MRAWTERCRAVIRNNHTPAFLTFQSGMIYEQRRIR